MKLRSLAALACAMVLSLSAAGMVFATEPTATPSDEWTASPSDEATATPSDEWTASPSDEATASPSDEATASPTDEATASPTDEETASPTDEETASPTDEETASPSAGEVEAATGTPSVTLPPTDSLSGGAGTGSGGVPIALLAMAGLMAAAVLMTPASVGFKRGKRRS